MLPVDKLTWFAFLTALSRWFVRVVTVWLGAVNSNTLPSPVATRAWFTRVFGCIVFWYDVYIFMLLLVLNIFKFVSTAF